VDETCVKTLSGEKKRFMSRDTSLKDLWEEEDARAEAPLPVVERGQV